MPDQVTKALIVDMSRNLVNKKVEISNFRFLSLVVASILVLLHILVLQAKDQGDVCKMYTIV